MKCAFLKYTSTLFIFSCFYLQQALCQEFGGHPFNQQWKQINTDTVRIIFQEGFEKQASRIARIEHRLMSSDSLSIGMKFKKVNIVLQNHTLQSNGYVGIAPFRSEFYTTGHQNPSVLGSLPFLDLLALHEYRHVQQEVNFRRGWNKLLYFLNGEIGWSVGSNLAVPNWFFEGDAVLNETRFSSQGRGRLPMFYDSYRGLLLDQKFYSYSKSRNGSFKDFVPNHYEFGYLMCVFGIEKFGKEVWSKTTQNTFYRIPFYPFSRALKKQTGWSSSKFYRKTIENFNMKNTLALDTIRNNEAKAINSVSKKTYTSYQYPYQLPNGDILALKKSFDKVPTIVTISKNQTEKEIVKQGFTNHDYISYRNGKIAWVESSLHPRWAWRDYSEIVIYDLATCSKKRITNKTKLFSPECSHDGKYVVAIEINEQQKCSIHILDASFGNIKIQLPNIPNYFLSFPRWDETDNNIYVAARDAQGQCAVIKVNISSGNFTTIIPFQNQTIGQFTLAGSKIIYSAAYQGFDNLYAFDTLSKTYNRISQSLVGQYEPSISIHHDSIFYSSFTSKGRNIYSTSVNDMEAKQVAPLPLDSLSTNQSGIVKNLGINLLTTIDTTETPSTKYTQISHLTYFHSWVLKASNPLYGLSLMSENILNNTLMELGAFYNSNENRFQKTLNFTYGGFYSILNAGTDILQRDYKPSPKAESISFNEVRTFLGTYVPLNYTRGIFNRIVKPIAYYSFRTIYGENIEKFYIHSSEIGFEFLNSSRKAYQHIFSRFGQYLAIKHLHSFNETNLNQLNIASEFNFPSIFSNHLFSAQIDYLNDKSSQKGYRYQDLFVYPRGYGRFYRDQALKVGLNYHLPLCYPDFGLAGIVYFKRLRTNFFFDYCRTSYVSNSQKVYTSEANSIGIELLFDLHFFNTSPLYSVFIRYATLFGTGLNNNSQENNVWEIGFPLVRIN